MDRKLDKILACVDFSPYSLLTMEYALEFAKGRQTQILVFNVINQSDLRGIEMAAGHFPGCFPSGMTSQEYINRIKEERSGKIKLMIKEHFFDEKSRMSIKIDTGIPYECILNAIETEGIDLVVMANKGRSNLERFLFGSSAEKVFRHSPVPVASVREREKIS
ncbi:universal stress protein [Desulfospira joergensenii]|uniref:universal stress protein n=1 Tax=Desulfospira joergensenii TaxID=53329 RepID=UPI0003B75F1C|nr:universal stress protein [Desulfospira joergensenii]